MDIHNNNRLTVGIDIGRNTADYCLLHPNGRPVVSHSAFTNTLSGYQEAQQLLLKTLETGQFDGLQIAIEATSYYWLPLFIQLHEDPALEPYQPQLTLLNARWVSWHKKGSAPDHKTDQRDPYYIAKHLLSLDDPIAWRYDPHWLTLRLLTRVRFHMVNSLVREKNYYHLHLFLAYSCYTSPKVFSTPFIFLSQHLLSHPELLEEYAEMPLIDLAQELTTLSLGRLIDPRATAERLRACLHDSYPIPPDLIEPLHSILTFLSALINCLTSQIALIDKLISDLVEHDYPEVAWLRSIPGIGPVFASGIAAEIGGIDRFFQPLKFDKKRNVYRTRNCRDAEDAVAKWSGLWWPKRSSGSFSAEDRPMSKEGNAYLRYYLIEAADRMRQRIPAYTDFYEKKYKEASKRKHKRALVLSGRKAIGLVVGLLYHQEFFRPEEVRS